MTPSINTTDTFAENIAKYGFVNTNGKFIEPMIFTFSNTFVEKRKIKGHKIFMKTVGDNSIPENKMVVIFANCKNPGNMWKTYEIPLTFEELKNSGCEEYEDRIVMDI